MFNLDTVISFIIFGSILNVCGFFLFFFSSFVTFRKMNTDNKAEYLGFIKARNTYIYDNVESYKIVFSKLSSFIPGYVFIMSLIHIYALTKYEESESLIRSCAIREVWSLVPLFEYSFDSDGSND